MTLARLALLDLSRRRAIAGVQLVGMITAVALAVALPLMQAVAAEEGLRSALVALGTGANLELELDRVPDAATFDSFQTSATRRVNQELGGIMVPALKLARSNQLRPVSLNGVGLVHEPGDPVPVVTYYQDLQPHVVVTSGQWPADEKSGNGWWATVSESSASLLGLKAGDVYCLGPTGGGRNAPAPFCVHIGAVWRPLSLSERFWGGQLPGTEVVLGRTSLFALNAPYVNLHAAQVYAPDLSRVHAADAASIREHLQRLHADFGVTSDATFITGLGDAIQLFLQRFQAQQALAVSVEIALLAVALYAIGLAGASFLDAQKPLIGLWRARGGSRLRAWILLMLQFGALAVVSLPLGALLGALAVAIVTSRLFGAADVLETGVLAGAAPTLVAALAAIAVVLGALTADATRRSVAESRRSASRPATEAWWRRPGVDAAMAVGGALLLAEYRLQAGAITSTGPDPLGMVLPGIALALLAVAALRLMPYVARLIASGQGLAARLARWRLERQPLLHARVALLLSFALALGVFASVYLATDQRNAVDRAAYSAGADVRVFFGFGTAPSVLDSAIAAAPGKVDSSRVFRDDGRPGRSDVSATVLGVDPSTLPSVIDWRSDFASSSLATLMSALAQNDPDGVLVRGDARTLTMWVYSTGVDATLTAQLRDRSGRELNASFGALSFTGWRELQATIAGGDAPLRLRTLAVTPNTPTTSGEIDLSDLSAGADVIAPFAASGGWWQETVGLYGGTTDVKVGTRVHDGKQSVAVPIGLGGGTVALHPTPSTAALPGIISTSTAAKLAVGIGKSFPLHIETNDVTVKLVGTTDYFPTLYPGQDDFLIVPEESLVERLRAVDAYVYPNEGWLKVSGSTSAVAAAVDKASHGQAHVVDRQTLETAALTSPLRRSLDAALVIGFFAALAMVVVGFGLHFLAAARGRVGETAIMQANGLPWNVVDRALFIEQVAVLCHGVVTGAVLGALLAWAILPVLETSVLPAELIPPTIVTLDVRTLVAAIAAMLASAWIVGWLTTRAAGRFELPAELRALA